MPLAYVLINVEVGAEVDVLDSLRKIENVEEAHIVYGVYDIVAKVRAKTSEELRKTITERIRSIDNILSTATLVVAES